MITAAGSHDPVSVSINRLSGRCLNRCGQKSHRFLFGAPCSPYAAFVLHSYWLHALVIADQFTAPSPALDLEEYADAPPSTKCPRTGELPGPSAPRPYVELHIRPKYRRTGELQRPATLRPLRSLGISFQADRRFRFWRLVPRNCRWRFRPTAAARPMRDRSFRSRAVAATGTVAMSPGNMRAYRPGTLR